MVVAFSNLHTESSLKSVNDHLSGKTYVSGDQLTKDDNKVYREILEKPSSDIYPNASKSYQAISAKLVSSFPRKVVGVRFGSQTTPDIVAPSKEAAKPSDDNDDDDDDIDHFGEETKEEKKVAEAREAAKASTKKKVSGNIEVEDLLWAASKLVPVGYGIKKKQIMLTIIDELISVDTLIEERLIVEPINEYVQSCDIVAFSKI
ncbi:hypothetical protein P3S68_004151 [Capsicum galapagoense]